MRRKNLNRRYKTSGYHRRSRRLRQFLTIFVLALVVSGAIFLTYAKKEVTPDPKGEQTEGQDAIDVSEGVSENVSETEKEPEALPSRGEKPEIPDKNEESAGAESQPEEETETDAEDTVQTGETSVMDGGTLVSASDAVDLDYFDDAVFIGDSRTEGLFINTGLSNATFLTHQGLTVDEVFTKDLISVDGKKVTVMEALAQTSFHKVYIMLGINETGWIYDDVFIQKYGEIIDGIREINPNAVIYVQSILPVTNEVSSTHSYIKNEKIDTYNQLLQAMAEEKGVYYLDVAEAVADSDGSLPADAATDGIHLKKEPCQAWLTYLREHTVQGPDPSTEKGTV